MEKKLLEMKNYLNDLLQKNNIIVDDIVLKRNTNNYFLTIVLDKVGGIDLESIDNATKIIKDVINKTHLINDKYIIDVISKERG